MKIAVYSCITGDYVKPIQRQNTNGAEYFLFSDKYKQSFVWRHLNAVDLFNDPRRNARYHKLLPHEYFSEYDYTMWVDGSMEVVASPSYLVRKWMPEHDITVFKHPDRKCVYDEATVVKGKFFDYASLIDKQMRRYEKEGYPKKNGLSETKIVIRRNSEDVEKFNKLWFYELTTNSLRDQLSFDYCAWKTSLRVNRVAPMQEGQKAFKYTKHAEKRDETRYK